MNNARTMMLAFEQSTDVIAERFDSSYEMSQILELTVFLSIVSVVIVAALGLVIPMVLSADRLRNKVIDLFMDVPIVVVRKLRGLTRKQLEQINVEMDDDEDRGRAIMDVEDEAHVRTCCDFASTGGVMISCFSGLTYTLVHVSFAEYQLGSHPTSGIGQGKEERQREEGPRCKESNSLSWLAASPCYSVSAVCCKRLRHCAFTVAPLRR